MLIVRSFADEATALLVAAQFFEIVVSMFWDRRGAVDRALLSWGSWVVGRLENALEQGPGTRVGVVLSRFVRAWALLGFAGLLVLIPVSWYFHWTQPDAYAALFLGPYTPAAKWIWGGIALLAAPFVVAFAALAAVIVVILACGATIGLVVVVANICLSLVMLVVVPELGPMAFVMAISAEPVPGAGTFRVLQIRPQHKIGMVETRFHSTTYADLAALDGIADFIAQRGNVLESLRQPPSK